MIETCGRKIGETTFVVEGGRCTVVGESGESIAVPLADLTAFGSIAEWEEGGREAEMNAATRLVTRVRGRGEEWKRFECHGGQVIVKPEA